MNPTRTDILVQPANSQMGGIGTTADSALSSARCQGRKRVRSVHMSMIHQVKDDNDIPRWYVLRATHGRAQAVYDELILRNLPDIELYLAVRTYQRNIGTADTPVYETVNQLLLPNWVFVRCTRNQYAQWFTRDKMERPIHGMSVCYNHCSVNSDGLNPFLYIPDYQMQSFRIVVESPLQDVIVDQTEVPTYLEGDHVRVIGGPFRGVEGYVMRWKRQQKRVFVLMQGVGCVGTTYIPNFQLEKIAD